MIVQRFRLQATKNNEGGHARLEVQQAEILYFYVLLAIIVHRVGVHSCEMRKFFCFNLPFKKRQLAKGVTINVKLRLKCGVLMP